MKRYFFCFFCCLFFYTTGFTQTKTEPFIKLTDPLNEVNSVSSTQKFIIGSTCKSCTININDINVKVFPTGAFVYELALPEGESNYIISAKTSAGKTISKTVTFSPINSFILNLYCLPDLRPSITNVDNEDEIVEDTVFEASVAAAVITYSVIGNFPV